jgi:hypothetical protein
MLQAPDDEGRLTRHAILSSQVATELLERALQKGIKFAERILDHDFYGRNFKNEDIEFVIRACEAYGRFCLHKESLVSLDQGREVSVNRQLNMLLVWTTEKVVPALMRLEKGGSFLEELDLSIIPNISDSIMENPPGSPSVASPPKQKANLGRTPEFMRGSSSLFETSLNDPPVIVSQKLAIALLSSSCNLCSELLAMGVTSTNYIADAAVGWSKDLEKSQKTIENTLFSCFTRLAIQLNRSAGDCSLLVSLLVVCNDIIAEDVPMRHTIKSALSSLVRFGGGPDSIVTTFLNVVDCLLHKTEGECACETVESDSGSSDESGAIQILMEVILENEKASLQLAEDLVTRLSSSTGDATAPVTFHSKCLSLVMNNSVERATVSRMLRQKLNLRGMREEGAVNAFVESLVGSQA